MYIRRKVFSKLQTEDGQERYFSTIEFTRISEAEQREFSRRSNLKEDLKKAVKEGDEKKIKELEKKAIRRKTLAGAIMGAAGGGITGKMGYKKLKDSIIDHLDGKTSVDLRDDKNYTKVSNLASGVIAGGAGLVGAAAGASVGKVKFNKALKKAKKELQEEKEEKNNSKKAPKKCC